MRIGATAMVGMVCEMVMSGENARRKPSNRSMSTAKAKPTAQPITRPSADSASVVAELETSSGKSPTSAAITCVGVGSMKLGTMPHTTSSCQATRMASVVTSGIATRRARPVPCGAGRASPLELCAMGYATSALPAGANSGSPSWYLETLCSVDMTSPSGR